MTLLSVSDFINELLIPGTENSRSGVSQELCAAIEKYEPIFLSAAMGYGFYKDMLANIGTDGSTTPEYEKLVDGDDYTSNGILYKWDGLREYTAQYVYYWYWRNAMTNTTLVGQTISQTENAAITTPAFKMVTQFNNAMNIQFTLWPYLNVNIDSYPAYNKQAVNIPFFTPINTFGI